MQEFTAFLSMLGTLLLICGVFVAAYFVSKAIGKRYQFTSPSGSGGIEVIDSKMVGKEQSLVLVRTAERVFLLSVTAHHIEKIEELDPALYPKKEGPVEPPPNFLTIFTGMIKDKVGMHTEGGKKDGDK